MPIPSWPRRPEQLLLVVITTLAAACSQPQDDAADVGGVRFAFASDSGLFGKDDDRSGGVAIADLGGRGINDVFVVNGRHWEEDNLLLRNDGSGVVFQQETVGLTANTGYRACPGDVDNDDDIDVVVARDGPPPAVYVNSGDGRLNEVSDVGRPTASRDCVVRDLNNDGYLDAVFSERGGQSYALLGPLLESPRRVDLFEGPAVSVGAGDVDGDGLADIAFSLRGSGSVALLLQSADGAFTTTTLYGSADEESRAVAVHDLDGDGRAEVILAGLTAPSHVLGFTGNALVSKHEFKNLASASAVTVADLNVDGQDDIVFGVRGRNVVAVAKGDGYILTTLPGLDATTYAVAAGDLNGDGVPDLVFANSGDKNEIVLSHVE